jgi:hypothetical protein
MLGSSLPGRASAAPRDLCCCGRRSGSGPGCSLQWGEQQQQQIMQCMLLDVVVQQNLQS